MCSLCVCQAGLGGEETPGAQHPQRRLPDPHLITHFTSRPPRIRPASSAILTRDSRPATSVLLYREASLRSWSSWIWHRRGGWWTHRNTSQELFSAGTGRERTVGLVLTLSVATNPWQQPHYHKQPESGCSSVTSTQFSHVAEALALGCSDEVISIYI